MVKTKDDVIKLDDTDINILKIINEDVRTSYRQISRSLDVSVGTIHNRIDKMVKSGVIKKFSPVIDHEKLGFVLTTIIGVRVKGGKLKNWEEKTFFNKNVVGIYDVTGEYDAFLIAKFRNTTELNVFIKELLKDPMIERTYTQTVLDVIKEDMGSSNMLVTRQPLGFVALLGVIAIIGIIIRNSIILVHQTH